MKCVSAYVDVKTEKWSDFQWARCGCGGERQISTIELKVGLFWLKEIMNHIQKGKIWRRRHNVWTVLFILGRQIERELMLLPINIDKSFEGWIISSRFFDILGNVLQSKRTYLSYFTNIFDICWFINIICIFNLIKYSFF